MQAINNAFKNRLLNKNVIYRFYSKKIDKYKTIYPFNLDKISYMVYMNLHKYEPLDFFKYKKYKLN